jgi:hypothetical protein
MSRNVQKIRLSQNITTKAAMKAITMPSEPNRLVSVELVEDVVVAVAVLVAVVVAVGDAAGPRVNIVVRICVIFVIVGQTPLSEIT